jgi:MFS-type transporter involved in bile tolerance (Atg22 family)
MNNKILNLNKNRKKDSRRDFLKIASTFFCVVSIPMFTEAKKVYSIQEDEFVIVDGWVLKKEDLHDL